MSLGTKLSGVSAVAAAFVALAMPSMAGATEATCPGGTLCPVGTAITKTAKNIALDTQFVGKLGCTAMTLNGVITKNSEGVVTGSGSSEKPAQTECYVNGESSKPIIINTVKLSVSAKDTKGPVGATKHGTVSFVAKLQLPSGANCEFTGTNIPGTFVSGQSPGVLKVADPEKDVTSTGGCGKARLLGECLLEKTGTTIPVVLD